MDLDDRVPTSETEASPPVTQLGCSLGKPVSTWHRNREAKFESPLTYSSLEKMWPFFECPLPLFVMHRSEKKNMVEKGIEKEVIECARKVLCSCSDNIYLKKYKWIPLHVKIAASKIDELDHSMPALPSVL